MLSFICETGYDTNTSKLAAHFAGVTQTTVCEALMKLGYARISKADGSQTLDLQLDALANADVAPDQVYKDEASGKKDNRPGLEACLKALRKGDTLYIWKLDRLGRDLKHLVTTVRNLSERGVGLCVLTGQGANIDTTTSSGKLIFGIFAALAEFEGDLIRERTMAGLAAARARGRKGGRQFALTKNQIRLAQAAMANRDTNVADLCSELGITRATLYRYVGPTGQLRDHAKRVLKIDKQPLPAANTAT
ncbi:resolvase domain-containing protein [Roseibium sp. TrichSKD4]|nr:resolvase domain-containing protein [Roseibium sp. TrichSKD4]